MQARLVRRMASVAADVAAKPIIAMGQMCSTSDVEMNLQLCRKLCVEAKAQGACFLSLPECFEFMGTPGTGDSLAMAQPLDSGPVAASSHDRAGSLFSRYQKLAKEHKRRGTEAFISLEALLCQTAVQHYQLVQHSERVPRCFRLAAAGQLEALRAALEEDASDIDSAFLCITPVAAAALFGHADCMELLLSKGARPEPSEYHRPILYACLKGHYACVRLLLAAGATAGLLESESDTDSEDENWWILPERVRCQSGTEMWDLDSLQLAEDFADLGVEGAAALSQLEEFFDGLHAQWSGFCARHRWRKCPRWQSANCKECFRNAKTLHAHIDRRQCQKVGRLRDLVMPLDTRHSPLQCAAEVDSVECVEVLLTAGAAELEPFLERGHWALLTACQHGSVRSAAKIIAETPASLSVRTKKGATPLMQACLCGQVTIVRLPGLPRSGRDCQLY